MKKKGVLLVLTCSSGGDNGDRNMFTQYVHKNATLYALRNNVRLSTPALANWTRRELADALRKNPYQTNLLLAGYDEKHGPSLYFIDYLASLQKLPFACHGYAGNFLLGLLDREYKADMTVDEAHALVLKCIEQLQTRMVLSQNKFTIKVVDANGIRVLNDGN
jgi:20S proteasome subunit beta 4